MLKLIALLIELNLVIVFFRYISHVPLAVPHYTTCDTSILNKPVPANTTVSVHFNKFAFLSLFFFCVYTLTDSLFSLSKLFTP